MSEELQPTEDSDLLLTSVQAAQEYVNVAMRYITLDNCDSYCDRRTAEASIARAAQRFRRALDALQGWLPDLKAEIQEERG